MEKPLLVASDVDGTLLGDDERVSPRTAAVIGRLVAAGIPFVLATGRPPRWIPPVAQQLGVARLAVCANGAVLYDVVEDRVLWSVTLDVGALAALAEAATAALPGCRLAVERVARSAFEAAAAQFVAEPDYRHAWPNPDNSSASRVELIATPAVKMLIRHPAMSSAAMCAALAPLVPDSVALTYSTDGGLLEASASGVSKATGLAEVAMALAVERSAVIAFGDMPNDIDMLNWAGHGVAMANAHPDLLTAADEVTASNIHDGVAQVLERWF